MKTKSKRSTPGFTLVELLVVILIIAGLAALSSIGIIKMRRSGDRAAAIEVMHQLAIANTTYSIDHNGQFVPIVTKDENNAIAMEWYRDPAFRSYLTGDPDETQKDASQMIVAPQSVIDPVVFRAKKRQYDRLSASYGFNSTGLTWPQSSQSPPMSYKLSQVASPSRTAFIVSSTNYMVSYAGRKLWWDAPVEGKTTTDKMAFRHGDKAIVVYYDGSSGMVSKDDMNRFDANGGVANPFWKAIN